MKKLSFESFASCKISTNQLNHVIGGECTGGGFEVRGNQWHQWTSDEKRDSQITGGTWITYNGNTYGVFGGIQ